METIITNLTNYMWTQSWHIAVLFIIVAAAAFATRKASAHWRYLLWCIILAKCLIPPIITLPLALLPEKTFTTEATASTEKIAIQNTEIKAQDKGDFSVGSDAAPPYVPQAVTPPPTLREKLAAISTQTWAAIVWLTGFALFILIAAAKAFRTNQWLVKERKALTTECTNLKKGITEAAKQIGLKKSPMVWLVNDIGQPFVWGLFRGSIYLPADFAFSSIENRKSKIQNRSILLHELAHVRRFDAGINFLQVITQALFWFHPLVWWSNRKIRQEREKCCDETAVATLAAAPAEYGKAIVDTLIREYQSERPIPSLAIAGPIKNIEERIKTLMLPGKKFYRRPSLLAVITVLLAAIVVVPITFAMTTRPPGLTIKGIVTDANTGKPIAGAKVGDSDYDKDQRFGITGADGRYSYKTWPEEHAIAADATGYKKMTKVYPSTFFQNEKEVIFDFALEPTNVAQTSLVMDNNVAQPPSDVNNPNHLTMTPATTLIVYNDDFVSLNNRSFQCVIHADLGIGEINASGLLFISVSNSAWNNLSINEYNQIMIRSDASSKIIFTDPHTQIQYAGTSKSAVSIPYTCYFFYPSGQSGLMRITDFNSTANPPYITVQYKFIHGRYSPNPITITEGRGFDSIIINDPNTTIRAVIDKLGQPEHRDNPDSPLLIYDRYGLRFFFSSFETAPNKFAYALTEIKIMPNFKGKLSSGITTSSSMQDVFNTYGQPLEIRESTDLDKSYADQVLFKKCNANKIYCDKNGVMFWFKDNRIDLIDILLNNPTLFKQNHPAPTSTQQPVSNPNNVTLTMNRVKGNGQQPVTSNKQPALNLSAQAAQPKADSNKAKILVEARFFTVDSNSLSVTDFLTNTLNIPDANLAPDKIGQRAFILTDDQTKKLTKLLQSKKDARMLQAPRVHVLDGEQAVFTISTAHSYIKDYKEPNEAGGKPQPVTETITDGIKFDATPILQPDKNILLKMKYICTNLLKMNTKVYKPGYEIGIPSVESTEMDTTVLAPDGRTIFIPTGAKMHQMIDNDTNTIAVNLYLLVNAAVQPEKPDPNQQPDPNSVGKMEFRIAPTIEAIGQNAAAQYAKELTEKGTESVKEKGDEFRWFEARNGLLTGNLITGKYHGQPYVLLKNKEPDLMLADKTWGLEKVYSATDAMGRLAVGFDLDENGSKYMYNLSKANIHKPLAIIVDGRVLSVPYINSAISKAGFIEGRFTKEEVTNLIESLKKGMPPTNAVYPQNQTEPLGFAQSVVKTLNNNEFLSLASDKIFTLPKDISDTQDVNAFVRWEQSNNIDFQCVISSGGKAACLGCVDMAVQQVYLLTWYEMSAAEVEETLADIKPSTINGMTALPTALPNVYLFRNRTGQMGVLKIDKVLDTPPAIQFQYKLIAPSPIQQPETRNEQPVPDPNSQPAGQNK